MSMPLSSLKEVNHPGSRTMKDDKHKGAFQLKNPLCDKHFHFKAFILKDVMSIYFYIMSALVRRQLGGCKKREGGGGCVTAVG